MRYRNTDLHDYLPKFLVIFFSLWLIAVLGGLAGCGSDDDPGDPGGGGNDPTDSEEATFTGDVGVVVEVAETKVEILPGSVSGDWTVTVAIGDQANHGEAGNVQIAGPIVGVDLVPTSGAKVGNISSLIEGPILTVSIPLDEKEEFTDKISGVMTAGTGQVDENMVAFLDPVFIPSTRMVELTVEAVEEGYLWLLEHAADGIEFYLASFPSECVTEADPQLHPFDSSALGDRQAMVLVHGLTVFDLCDADPEVLQLRTLAGDMAADEDISGAYKIYEYEYPVSRALAESGQDLATILQATFDPSTEIAIVAYSMGGLVARSAMEVHGVGEQVTQLITIGTPHQGTFLADSQDALSRLNFRFSGIPRYWASREDLMIGSTFITSLNALEIDRSDYLTIAGNVISGDCSVVPLSLRMTCQLATYLESDLVVEGTSALLPEKAQSTFTGIQYNHESLPELQDVRDLVLQKLKPGIPQEGELFSLAVGNWWSYLFNGGTEHKLGISGSSWVNVDGQDVLAYHWNWFDDDVPSEYYWLVMSDERGLWTLASHSPGVEEIIDPQLWFKYPVSVGDQWSYRDHTVRCQDVDRPVSVIAGSFSCINYLLMDSGKAGSTHPGQIFPVSSPWFPPTLDVEKIGKASYTVDVSPGIGLVQVVGDRGYVLLDYFLVE